MLWLTTLLLMLTSMVAVKVKKEKYHFDVYPTKIAKFTIRKDIYSGKTVVSGLIHTLANKSSLTDFRRHLQCSPFDANLNYNNGMISMLQIAPPTVKSYEAFCAFVESRDRQYGDWALANGNIESCKQGEYYKKKSFNKLSGFSRAELIRVINGTLYYDWPWGIDRFNPNCNDNMMTLLMEITLNRISDMEDSAFFIGGADPRLPVGFPIPYFAFSTHETYADMVLPWSDVWKIVLKEYLRFREHKIPFTEEGYIKYESSSGYRHWKDKIPKAALFASLLKHRQILFDIARLNPDYIEAGGQAFFCVNAWHPLSTEEYCEKQYKVNRTFGKPDTIAEIEAMQSLPAGYRAPLFKIVHEDYSRYEPAAYKYVIVPLGEQGVISTSGRIVHILTYTGSVVLLQSSSYRYHFSAQFLPWVHYVPFTFAGGDLLEKIQWLRDHDDLAKQIAENGRNFARSFLRLEDFYCYMAHTLETMAKVTKEVSKVHFSPKKVGKQCNIYQHILYQIPV